MSSTNICHNFESEHADMLIRLLELNDSSLLTIMSQYENGSLEEYRETLTKTLLFEIPGKLLYPCQIYNVLWRIIPPIMLLVGSIGNTLAFVVLFRNLIGKCSSYIYLAAMVVIDEIILLSGLLRRYLGISFRRNIENEFNIICRCTQFIGVASSLVSVWLIVVVTVERVIVIYLPLRAKQVTQRSIAKRVISFLVLMSSLIASHFFFTLDTNGKCKNSTSSSEIRECGFKVEFSHFIKIWPIIDASLYSFIPSSILIHLNAFIIREVVRSKNNRFDLTSATSNQGTGQRRKANSDTHHLSITLMAISILFLMTTTPLVMLKLVLFFKDFPNDRDHVFQSSVIQMLDVIFEFLMYLNHSINFLLYCATGNRFRQHVIASIMGRPLSSYRQTDNQDYIKSTLHMSAAEATSHCKR